MRGVEHVDGAARRDGEPVDGPELPGAGAVGAPLREEAPGGREALDEVAELVGDVEVAVGRERERLGAAQHPGPAAADRANRGVGAARRGGAAGADGPGAGRGERVGAGRARRPTASAAAEHEHRGQQDEHRGERVADLERACAVAWPRWWRARSRAVQTEGLCSGRRSVRAGSGHRAYGGGEPTGVRRRAASREHPMPSFAPRKHRALIALAAPIAACALAAIVLSLGGCAQAGVHRSANARGGVDPPAHGAAGSSAAAAAGLGAGTIPTLLPTPRPTGMPVGVSIGGRPSGPVTPSDFLGLSFEMRGLPLLARYATAGGSAGASAGSAPAGSGDLVALLRSLGSGVLRFGGASADEQVAWVSGSTTARTALPRWASTAIDAHDLAGIAALAHATGWRVLLTVNLGHYDPTAAAQEAAAARAALGPYLAGIELGNEPDMYVQKRLRPPSWGPASAGTPAHEAAVTSYRAQATVYRAAIAAAAPGVAVVGPDASTGTPGLAWVRFAARTLHPALLTDHYYPLSSCGYRPTVEELLSPTVRSHEHAMLAAQAAIARAAATPLRVDEANSISCEGRPGVSDSFASALWALDYTARAMSAGPRGRELPRPARKARRVQPAGRPHPDGAHRGCAARTAGVVRAARRPRTAGQPTAARACRRRRLWRAQRERLPRPRRPPAARARRLRPVAARARWPCGCESHARRPAQTDPTARDPTTRTPTPTPAAASCVSQAPPPPRPPASGSADARSHPRAPGARRRHCRPSMSTPASSRCSSPRAAPPS